MVDGLSGWHGLLIVIKVGVTSKWKIWDNLLKECGRLKPNNGVATKMRCIGRNL